MSERRDRGASHLAGRGDIAVLEERLRRHYGMPYALAVSSATMGLLAAGLALEVRGQAFVSTPYTWGGTLAGWLLLGGRPRFADIDRLTLGLSPEAVSELLGRGCRAVLGVDLFGVPSRHDELSRLAKAAGAWYVVDAAQSLGATYHGAASGASADVVVVSFTHGKTVDAGEGGAVLTRHREVYERLIWHTQHPIRQKLEIGATNEFALNGRIHPAAATEASACFDAAMALLPERRAAAQRVYRVLAASGLASPIRPPEFAQPSYYRLSASWRKRAPANRVQALEEALNNSGCSLRVCTAPVKVLYRQKAFRLACPQWRLRKGCPEAERQQQLRFCLAGVVDEIQFKG